MISKIDSMRPVSSSAVGVKKAPQNSKNVNNSTSNSVIFMGYQSAPMLQALNGINLAKTISFKGAQLSELEKSIIGPDEIRVPNLLDLSPSQEIDLSYKKMPPESRKLNSAGLDIVCLDNADGYRTYDISNDLGNDIAVLKVKKGAKLPTFTYKQGKFMPEVTVKDPSLKTKSVKCLAGSRLTGKDFTLIMPGEYEPCPTKGYKDISFTGRTVVTTLNKEDRTVNAVNKYMQSGLAQKTTKGDYYDEVVENDPTVIVPAGGFGERLKNITRNKENKPSGFLPTNPNYRIIATTLNAIASSGIIKGDGSDDLRYLSQNHEIPQNSQTTHVGQYKTDGGAIAEGLARDIIRNDRDSIILNADIFTNADISRTYHALKTLPNAALVIPYYPVNPERAKSFGLLGIEKDENGNMQIKSFLEKPKYTKQPPMPNDFKPGEYDKAMAEWDKVQTAVHPENDDVYLANPGMYFMDKRAAKVLMAKGILHPNETGLGANVMPEIVRLANEGQLLDENGNQLKVYTVPLEAKGGKPAVWDDIGTAEAYLSLIKDVAHETTVHGTTKDNKYYGVPEFVLNDFKNNTDLETGIVYDSPRARKAFDNFKQEYGITYAQGNIFVAGNKR